MPGFQAPVTPGGERHPLLGLDLGGRLSRCAVVSAERLLRQASVAEGLLNESVGGGLVFLPADVELLGVQLLAEALLLLADRVDRGPHLGVGVPGGALAAAGRLEHVLGDDDAGFGEADVAHP
jgi:hypothetical protein